MLRGRDLIGRIGGDQFVVLLPDTTAADAMHVVERMARQVTHKQADSNRRPVALSFGVVQVLESESLEDAIHRAGEALTEAQAQGSNCAVNGGLTADGQFQVLTTRPLARPIR